MLALHWTLIALTTAEYCDTLWKIHINFKVKRSSTATHTYYTHTHTHHCDREFSSSVYVSVRVYYEIESCKLVFMHGCWINWAKAVHTWMRFRESNHYHLRQFVGSRTYKCVHKSLPGKTIHFELNCKLLSSIWRRILMKSSLYNVYGWKMTLKTYTYIINGIRGKNSMSQLKL